MNDWVPFVFRESSKNASAKLGMGAVFKYGLSMAKDREYVRSTEAFILKQQGQWSAYCSLTPFQRSTKKNVGWRAELAEDDRQMERNWEFNRMPMSYSEFVVFVVVSNYLKQQEEKENGEVSEANAEEVGTGEGATVPIRTDGVRQSVDQDGAKKVR